LARNWTIYGGIFDLAPKRQRLAQLEEEIAGNPNFWTDSTASGAVLKEKKQLESFLARTQALKDLHSDLGAAIELAGEGEEFLLEATVMVASLRGKLESLETENMLHGEFDASPAILTIHAGAGGTESCDWAQMLFRMYMRYIDKKKWKAEIHDLLEGEEAGIKNVSIEVQGEFAYGLLKVESGVHRLVRISPFDSNARRHTSFASVFLTPVIEDDIAIDINPADLRIDTYRASGAGGQHINRTDSAVRITHAPSGIVVQCQSQRSQHQNKDTAMKMLRSKLYEREMEERRKKQQDVESAKNDIAWGSQIRSYVLHPYKLVKDHRTNFESSDPDGILDGGLDEVIRAALVLPSS